MGPKEDFIMQPIGHSYVRFSSKKQEEGESLKRQTAAARAWCERNQVTLDTSLTLQDLGRSAFSGDHLKCLKAYLDQVEAGRIPKGSFLIVENMDRLSRKQVKPALRKFLDLQEAGINIVTTTPEYVYRHDSDNMVDLLFAILEMSRAHGESARKSDLNTSAWNGRKDQARKTGLPITSKAPAWLTVVGRDRNGKHVVGGEFRVIPERAEVVRRIFELACGGFGMRLIIRQLTAEGIRPWGTAKHWTKPTLEKILKRRAVLGEHQPTVKRGKEPDGEPIKDYYPAVIDEQTWDRAQLALSQRKTRQGRVSTKVTSLFTGLLWDARTQARMRVTVKTNGKPGRRTHLRVLSSKHDPKDFPDLPTFPYQVFEDAILSELREIDPAQITGEKKPSQAAVLAAELAAHEQRMRQIEEQLTTTGDIPALARVLKTMDEKQQELVKRLSAARQKEAHPQAESWAETKTLIGAAQDPEARIRLRGALANVVESAWVLVIQLKMMPSVRVAFVQMYFRGDGRRTYVIMHQPKGNNREGFTRPVSMKLDDGPRGVDLRDKSQALRFAEQFAAAEELPE
jgi:DNA invertase Pin-like site-specific DNA recombinase